MKQDKIIKQYFENNKEADSVSNLNFLIMEKIHKTAEKKQKRAYYKSIFTVCCVSASMVVGSIWLLKESLIELWSKLSVGFLNFISQNKFSIEFYLFIASIALLLLLFDTFIRKKLQKSV